MLEQKGDLFKIPCDALCITTNGYVKTNGNAVMGKGCALEASILIPDIAAKLGKLLSLKGNRVSFLDFLGKKHLLSFPVKPGSVISDGTNVVKHMQSKFLVDHTVPGCFALADIEIIERSTIELLNMVNNTDWETVLIPRPGCGAGELDWKDIKPVLNEILDNRFISITFGE